MNSLVLVPPHLAALFDSSTTHLLIGSALNLKPTLTSQLNPRNFRSGKQKNTQAIRNPKARNLKLCPRSREKRTQPNIIALIEQGSAKHVRMGMKN